MDALNLSKRVDWSFIDEVSKESGQKLSHCYQCGNCTAGCPYTQYFDYPVSQVMRLLQVGQKETILSSRAIWLCATCETCTTRCPCEIDVANVMDTLRIIARRENKVSEKEVKLFYDSFLASMKQHGRLFEVGTLITYNLKSGHFMADAELGPKVMEKGKVHFFPKNIKGRDKVAKIFARFQEKAKNHG
ncbi:4Fe-4S dicluster domain-containing protein [Syntrophorhabdus aromaticivorans]|jgi:heterodisulfide reductase subunit C|uniref:Heterodisulfide reductase subunit C n=1 Tax=Syntrophorhabdus aromaticivorans TaxID=328301 RepID=A0A351U3U0_9BACT|nr:4Fe-4S dicluster domain-containing protein [Syntrophorhabdus aromaticivorans]NLW36680.1 heterodisulfide reductase subunit C [Syntrophorhabdus aromaticivorans]HBA54621.1 heterodisulfide reductase subunit C [Syntrophorhabdus aromaticivorans]